MKLTPKLKAEILSAYHTFWDANLNGEIKIFASFLDENVHIIGSTSHEVFLNKKDAVKFYSATAEQTRGKAEIRNRKIKVLPSEDNIRVYEECDFYFLHGKEWNLYDHARIDALFAKKENHWKITHMHCSLPDARTEQGEQFAADKIAKENIQLREAVKRRTVELEQKNHELKIEAALEKVRAQAMALKKADDLPGICKVVFENLEALGFSELRNTMINIHNDEQKTFVNYDYSDEIGESANPLTYDIHPVIEKQIRQIRKAKDAFSETVFKGKDLTSWKRFRKNVGEKDDARIKKCKALHYYFYSIGTGAIGISTFNAISQEKLQLLKRFRNVFNLAYKRYTDISLAEAQVREAEIELALERVRAKTMAMQKSEELSETAYLLFQQFTELGHHPDQFTIGIINEQDWVIEFWHTWQGSKMDTKVCLSIDEAHVAKKLYKAWKKKLKSVIIDITGKQLKAYNRHRKERLTEAHAALGTKFLDVEKRRVINATCFSKGIISISTDKPVAKETVQLLQRFTSVFEQTYTRFLDLQKAEAQTREAKIEAALEKVRSRSLAMHKAEELIEVASVLRTEMGLLGVEELETSSIYILNQENTNTECWYAIKDIRESNGKLVTDHMTLDLNETWVGRMMCSFYHSGEKKISILMRGENRKEWINYCATKSTLLQGYYGGKIPERTYHLLKFSNGYMGAASPGAISAESWSLLQRATSVFSFAYTRFLDLQKAEAQAREAQIQLALERVRARTMGMHKSEELLSIITVVSEQLQQLSIKFSNVSFGINSPDYDLQLWMAVKGYPTAYRIQWTFIDNPGVTKLKEAQKQPDKVYSDVLTQADNNEWLQHIFNCNPPFDVFSEENRNNLLKTPGYARSIVSMKDIFLVMGNYAAIPYSYDDNVILKRFANVFEQSYTRFLDLKKAEAQAREAQIETSLERVRSKTMAMHNSQDVGNTITTLFEELVVLGLDKSARCGIVIMNDSNITEVWAASNNNKEELISIIGTLDMTLHPVLERIKESWKSKKQSFTYKLEGAELIEYYKMLNDYPGYPIHVDIKSLPKEIVHNSFSFAEGIIFSFTPNPISDEFVNVFKKFAGVFGQTYKRYLDLQRAEAQSRESQIQLALERARAQSMIMQRSNELDDTLRVFHQQILLLGIRSAFSFLWLPDEVKDRHIFWAAWAENSSTIFKSKAINYPLDRNEPATAQCLIDWKSKDPVVSYHVTPSSVKDYFGAWSELFAGVEELRPENFSEGLHYVEAFMKYGCFGVMVTDGLTDDEKKILSRLTIEFERTYTRFLDLQKAEASAREATIEASLEKVRGKAMAMHSSEDLVATIGVFSRELEALNITPRRVGVGLIDKEKHTVEISTMSTKEQGGTIELNGIMKLTGHPVLEGIYDNWILRKEYHPVLRGAEIKEYYQVIRPQVAYPEHANDAVQYGYFFYFPEGGVFSWTEKELSEDELQIYRRFTTVLSLTYKRYYDLKQAEEQTREATIEAALEKVRGKAMAMHNSNDLTSTASQVFTELRKLGIKPMRAGVGLQNKENRKVLLYSATSSAAGDSLSMVGSALLDDHPVLINIHHTWLRGEDYFFVMSGDVLKTYYEKVTNNFNVPDQAKAGLEHHGYFLSFSEGSFYGYYEHPITEAEIKILHRFKSIIDLTFRRYIELQKAEANAKDAIRQASLDRVRAEIASMRTTKDLESITPLIWRELTILGIPFVRCGVFIMDDEHQHVHTYLSTPDGKAIGAFHLPFNSSGNLSGAIEGWHQRKIFVAQWEDKDFQLQADVLMQQGAIANREEYLATIPKEGIYLHFLPFLQGMLYVGNTSALHDDDLHLVQSVADAFSTAYARYEDFNKLEAAKQTVEKTLTDLKQTQTQLVQSEKMASLGELTAGIAHEIQNPLNFVNNFSEVSSELLDEMKAELDKGNTQEAMELAKDVITNLEKINHHGKRAGDIVKSMLQHSRTNSGQKELTDINALCDEYLRLSYHGLRAKDRSFNSSFKTDFDSSLGKVNVISQDIGRVILNLLTNAFYVVNEKSSLARTKEDRSYEPTVTVSTKRLGDKVEIRVSDNGNGIPQKVLDKIFQPFFTTKPTGQGTGLGLSLSYDIVTKGHGGELKVETKEKEGSEFIIRLPIS